jgi:AcrR family transcriptional regulator
MRTRLSTDDRKAAILAAALDVAESGHYRYITRDQVAEAAGCSAGLVSLHFGTMDAFKDELMREAVRKRRAKIVAQGLVAKCAIALAAPEFLQDKARAGV